MKKVLTLLTLLCMVCTGAWAQTQPPFTFTSWRQDSWTRMNNKSTVLTSNIKDATYINYSNKTISGDLRVTIKHQSGSRRRYINGVELLQNNQVVYSTYQRKHDNADATGAVYTISDVANGSYTIRIWSSQNTDNQWANNTTRVNITNGSTAIVTNNDVAVGTWTTGDNSNMTDGLKAVCTSVGQGLTDGKFKYKEETVTFTEPGRGVVKYNYTGAASSNQNERLDILGFEVLNEAGNAVVSSDAHYGYTGTNHSNREYTYTIPAAGTYKVRTWIDGVREPYSLGTVTYTFSSFDGIYEINNQSGSASRGYFVHSATYPNAPVLAETQLSGYTNRDVTDNRHDGSVNPYFGVKTINGKTYIYSLANGKFLHSSWSETAIGYVMALSTRNAKYVTLQNTNQSGSQYLCNACGNNTGLENHAIYTGNNDGGNDFVLEAVDAAKAEELRTTYASQIAAAEFAINGGWNMDYTGLTSPAEGGVTYLCKNYTGAKAMLPLNLDRDGLIAMHVSGYNGHIESVNEETHTITVAYDQNYTTTDVLWDGNGDASNTKVPAARIPAMIKAHNGDILAFSDWRYSRDDVGRSTFNLGYQVDIEMRRSRDGGQTWSPAIIAANGDGGNDRTTAGYGDASVVADSESDNVLLMCVNAAAGNRFVRFTSSNNGETWSGPTNIASDIATVAPTSTFFTSGKMIQAKTFKKSDASFKRIYAPLCGGNAGDYVLYSDDFGQNWSRLGEGAAQTGSSDECRLIELPNGDILLESRGDGRFVNVFHYTNKETGEGSWGTQGQKTGSPATACNGDLDLVEAYPLGSNEAKLLLLEVAPRSGSPRSHVKYYYKEVNATPENDTYTNAMFVGGWTAGYEVCAGKSAYSSILNLGNGTEAILYEKAHSESETGSSGNPWGYDIKFEKHDISLITNNAYFGEDPSVEQTIVAILSDGNGNTFEHEYQGTVGTLPTVPAYCTVATDGSWAKVDDHFTYTAGITMPFVVSNNENTKYYNIYYPIATGGSPCYLYYNSNNTSQLRNDHSVTNKSVDDAQVMTASQENTYKYSWAIYGDLFTGFTFKNRQSNTFINIAGASASGTQNAGLAAEGSVFTLDYATNGTYNGRWTMQSGTGYIVLWSWSNDVATYNTNVNHEGGHFYLVEAPDFEAMTTTLGEKCEGLGTTLGTYAYTGSVEDLSTAKSIVAGETTPANAKQLKTLITALTNGRGTLNMPQPGSFLRLKSHKFGTYLNSATVAWNGNSNLLTLVNGKTGDNEKTTIMYLTEDRHLVTYATGMGLCNSIQIKTAASDPYEGNTVLTFSEDSKNNTGCYNIKGTYGTTNNYLYGYSDKLARNGSVTDECVWELEEVKTLPLTVGETKFATFYTPVNVAVPIAITPYVCHLDGENLAMYTCKQTTTVGRSEFVVIPAHTAVMINAKYVQTYSLPIVEDESIEEYSNNSFFGDVATKPFAEDYTYYSLQKDKTHNDGTVGFFIKPSGNFKGFQAFLKTENTQQVQRFNVTFDEDAVITGFANVLGTQNINIPAFDLSGRKVDANSHRGLYIMNGKKVIR